MKFDYREISHGFLVTIGYEKQKIESLESGAKSGAKLTDKQKAVLELINDNPSISYRKVAKILKITNSTAQKHFDNLKKKNIIIRIGSAKGGYWEIINNQ